MSKKKYSDVALVSHLRKSNQNNTKVISQTNSEF